MGSNQRINGKQKSKIFVKLFLIDKIKEIVLIGITYW